MSGSKLHKKQLTMVLFVRFLAMLGFGLVVPVLPFLVNDLGGNAFTMGLFLAVYSIMQFLFSPFWGRLSDRLGRKPILLIGLTGYGITFILFGLINHLWLLILIRALSGIVSSATLPTTMAYIADCTDGSERAKYMGFMGAASGMGMIVGPALGGVLSSISYQFSFIVAGGISLIIIPFALKWLPESLAPENREFTATKTRRFSLAAFKDALIIIYLFNFIAYFSLSVFETTFAYLGNQYVGMTARDMGFVFVFIGVVSVAVQMRLIGPIVNRLGEARVILGGNLLSVFGFLFIVFAAYSGNFLFLVITAAIYYSGNAFTTPTASALVSKRSQGGQGQTMGYFSSFGSLGRMSGPLVGGACYDIHPYLPYIGTSVLLVLAVLILGPKIQKDTP